MRFLHSLVLVFLASCGGAEFTTAVDAGDTGGRAGTAGTGGASSGGAGTGGAATGGTTDAASDTPSNTGGGGSGGIARNSGDCDTQAECGGDPCVELISGGYRVCISRVPAATACSVPAGECCTSSDCSGGGKCVAGPAQPSCGPVVISSNVCVSDACRGASDCSGANAICEPAGMLGNKAARCVNGGCRFDRDCDGSGASCAPIVDSCCNTLIGLYCVYPGGCRRDRDCATSQHCAIEGNRTACVSGAVACPVSSP